MFVVDSKLCLQFVRTRQCRWEWGKLCHFF